MFDLVKKGMYIGLGLASMTKDKIEAVAKDVAEKAKLSEEDGRKFAAELEDEAKKAQEQLRNTVEGMVQAVMKKMPCDKKFNAVEQRLAALEAKCGVPTPPAAEGAGDKCCGQECDCASK